MTCIAAEFLPVYPQTGMRPTHCITCGYALFISHHLGKDLIDLLGLLIDFTYQQCEFTFDQFSDKGSISKPIYIITITKMREVLA